MHRFFMIIAVFAALIFFILTSLWLLQNTMYLLIFSFVLAYLFHPISLYFESHKISRNIALFITFLIFFAVSIISGMWLFPYLFHQTQDFIHTLPDIAYTSFYRVIFTVEKLGFSTENLNLDQYLKKILDGLSTQTMTSIWNITSSAFTEITGILVGIINVFLIPFFFFYLSNEYEKILLFMKSLVPVRYIEPFDSLIKKVNLVLSGYIRGQITVCIILSTFYSIALTFLGLRFGFIIGILSGCLNLIPYVGTGLGILISLAVALTSSDLPSTFLGILIIFGIAQICDNFFMTPKIVGNKVGLHPLASMLALIAGANIAGFKGMLVAIPIAAIIKIILPDLLNFYKNSQFYRT